MLSQTVLCVFLGLVAVSALVWMVAYRVGFSEGRLTVPLRLINCLIEHKITCLHERPDRVALEMTLLLDVPEVQSRRLVDLAVARTSSARHPEHEMSPASTLPSLAY